MPTKTKGGYSSVDQAMLGPEFSGDFEHLESFCNILQQKLGPDWEIESCTDSYNGGGGDDIPESNWTDALDVFCKQFPEAWN